jgi:hypothetical protein
VGAPGTVLALFAAVCFVAGVWRVLHPVMPPPRLSALTGIWFGRAG